MDPSSTPVAPATDSGNLLPTRTLVGFLIAAVGVLAIGMLQYRSLEQRERGVERIERGTAMIDRAEAALSVLRDMETGQRGYLLTGAENYLLPLTKAEGDIPALMAELRALAAGDVRRTREVEQLAHLVEAKREELARTVALQRAGQSEAALALVRSGAGREVMTQARTLVASIVARERDRLELRQAEWQAAADSSYVVTLGGLTLLLVLIFVAAVMSARAHRAQSISAWLRIGQMGLSERLQGDQRLESIAENGMGWLSRFLGAPLAAVHVIEAGALRHVASHGRAAADGAGAAGTSLLRDAARNRAPMHVTDVPAEYFEVDSSLGGARVRELLLVPAMVGGRTHAVVELGFFRALRPQDLEFAERVAESLGVAVRAAADRSRLEELLEETQRQSEELQSQQEELRVSNEELEEQSRLARQGQAMLEAQQTELEQTNAQLEEQASLLEQQKDELTGAQATLVERAEELERVNRYKSEFLANMSHELRTPLNSTLILSKLLADNKHGHLSDEEVNFARIITSAGNDLLALINDILDLSKIEAGKLEIVVEPVQVDGVVQELADAFSPAIADKELAFDVEYADDAPPVMHTDRQRLAQILRNLMSNALKFTTAGHIALRVRADGGQRIAFDVVDTGIGLPAHQHHVIFEAFRQADGSTHRRFGGTGLGLSISRDLAQRLGGDIAVDSEPGRGSTFTLSLPLRIDPALAALPAEAAMPAVAAPVPAPRRPAADARPHDVRGPAPRTVSTAAPLPPAAPVADDREVSGTARVILAIEDDPAFASILRDLVRELGFRCVVALNGADGLAAAVAHAPSAILLDVVLPDLSGMSVLEQLKRDPRTRHIPVHMVSTADFRREARELGAIGYALKPVEREDLVEALRRLEKRFSQQEHRVLVVEDDANQRASMTALLGNAETRIVAVANAADALRELSETTFDCMVLDLNLPDLSGYQLLERMASRDDVAFPPVIVYTGRSLDRDEERQLMRYSDSIILKGARSPERLLDEVTLFLHQVESRLPPETQKMLREVRDRDEALDGRRVLIVEDDVRNVYALTAVLEPRGVQLEVARNGLEALAALERQTAAEPFDLVLMDIMMPEMDGLTATREIRKRAEWNRIPIIALTAKAMKDDREQCMAAGANDYIAKPLDVDRLLSLVRVWMPRSTRP